MHRTSGLWLAALAAALADAAPAWAQSSEKWPTGTGHFPTNPLEFHYGPGLYLNLVKIAVFWLVFLAWVRTGDWVNRDAQQHKNRPTTWNQVVFWPLIAAAIACWILPSFWLGLPIMVVALVVPLGAYVRDRNAKLLPADHVFTREHLRYWAAARLRPLGIKIAVEAKKKNEPQVALKAQGGDNREDSANQLKAKQLFGFPLCGDLIWDAIQHRAGSVMLDFSREQVAVRYQIDGVWNDEPPKDRKAGDSILEVMKTLANCKAAERVAPQRGTFVAQREKTKYVCRFSSQGTKTGERAIVNLDTGTLTKARLSELGMSTAMQEKLKAIVDEKRGFVVVSAPPGSGLSTLVAATVTAVDRFMRSVTGVEDAAAQELVVENVTVKTYDSNKQETLATILPALSRQYPDVYVVTELADGPSTAMLCNEIAEDRLVIGGIRAKEAPESLLRVLMLKVPMKQFVPVVSAAVNGRLLRRLCETCKEAYPTPPQTAQQLAAMGHPAEQLYRPPQPPTDGKKPPPPCTDCQGTGYRGRVGFFELLVIDDGVRAALIKQPTLETVKQAARKAGMRSLQEEGAALVAQGITSLTELMRALKE
ncbi:MAG TPA: ATPase, T2SS/T4P/T4SS family [Pirellulales bacterium]|jgi:type II secretory ATPase GspE/PulE/Tfp pilus assembly ATPase PilB-like protein|nr:ATPase, T2SS/T4P/T4SS family [Pirellulales bacterium]